MLRVFTGSGYPVESELSSGAYAITLLLPEGARARQAEPAGGS
jgi:hypothetical protein